MFGYGAYCLIARPFWDMCYMFSFPKLIWNIDSASVLLFFCYIGFVLKNTFYASVHIYADGKEL